MVERGGAALARRGARGERAAIAAKHSSRLRDAFINWRVLVCAAVNFCAIIGSVGLGLWMPQIIKGLGFGVVAVGFIAAIPYICGAIAMMLWARLSDRAGTELVRGIRAACRRSLVVCLRLCDIVGADLDRRALRRRHRDHVLPVHLLADPVEVPTGSAAAGGLAMIVSIGNLGGFVGPYLIGVIKQSTDSFSWALISVAAFLPWPPS